MADFVAVLKKTIDGMGETTPQMRERVYEKARSTIAAKLAGIVPPPPKEVAERQKRTLEDAIAAVEKTYAKPAPASDPLAELENIFSSIDRNRNTPTHVRPASSSMKAAEPVRQPSPPPVAHTAPGSFGRPSSRPVQPTPAPAARVAPSPAPVANDEPAPAVGPDEAAFTPKPRSEDFSAQPLPGSSGNIFEEPDRPRRWGRLVAAVAAFVVVAGAAYGIWLNGDALKSMIGGDKTNQQAVQVEPLAPAKQTAASDSSSPSPDASEPPANAPDAAEKPKFTQRLTPEGKEIDPGPAGGESTIGEGTSVVALTTQPSGQTPAATPAQAATPDPSAAANDPAAPLATENAPASEAAQPALAVGQKAIFYEERTSTSEGSAEPGNIVWSVVQESPGGEAPPEPAIRAEANIPGKNIQLRMTIRRNTDDTLPASHIIELIFLTPEGFEGGGIDNILRIAMKASEQDAGSPLIGIPAKIADGFFLVALNDTKADEQANLTLLRNQDWIDIPIIYKTGRRALITMEKGIPGDKVFDEAMKAWQEKSAG